MYCNFIYDENDIEINEESKHFPLNWVGTTEYVQRNKIGNKKMGAKI